jgi:hypothetical protein
MTMGAHEVSGVGPHEVGQLDVLEVEPGEILEGDFFVTISVDAHDHRPSMPAAADRTTDSRSGERAWTRWGGAVARSHRDRRYRCVRVH